MFEFDWGGPALGSGFFDIGTDYNDPWGPSTDLASYVGTHYRIEISGTSATLPPQSTILSSPQSYDPYISTPGLAIGAFAHTPSPNPITFNPILPPTSTVNFGANDAIGAFSGMTSAYLGQLADNAGQAAASMGKVEAQVVSHVVNAPSIANSVVSLGQVVHSYIAGDPLGVYTGAAAALTGIALTEMVTFSMTAPAIVGSLTFSPVLVAAVAVTVAAGGGYLAAKFVEATYNDWQGYKYDRESGDYASYLSRFTSGTSTTDLHQAMTWRLSPNYDR